MYLIRMPEPINITLHENDMLALMEVVTHYKMLYFWAIRSNESRLTEDRKKWLQKVEAIITNVMHMFKK